MYSLRRCFMSSNPCSGWCFLMYAFAPFQNQKSRGLRSGERGGHLGLQLLEITRSPNSPRKNSKFVLVVCDRAPRRRQKKSYSYYSCYVWIIVRVFWVTIPEYFCYMWDIVEIFWNSPFAHIFKLKVFLLCVVHSKKILSKKFQNIFAICGI